MLLCSKTKSAEIFSVGRKAVKSFFKFLSRFASFLPLCRKLVRLFETVVRKIVVVKLAELLTLHILCLFFCNAGVGLDKTSPAASRWSLPWVI